MSNTDLQQIGGWVTWENQDRWHALKTWRGIVEADNTGPLPLSKDEKTWCGLKIPSVVQKSESGVDERVTDPKVKVVRTPVFPKNVEESGTKCGKCMELALGSDVGESTEHPDQ